MITASGCRDVGGFASWACCYREHYLYGMLLIGLAASSLALAHFISTPPITTRRYLLHSMDDQTGSNTTIYWQFHECLDGQLVLAGRSGPSL